MRSPTLLIAVGLLLSPTMAVAAGLSPLEQLGQALFFDELASPDRQACASCHAPAAGFTGPNADVNARGAVMNGAITTRFGNRRPPSVAYATQAPVFHWDGDECEFVGGGFWDGRATGEKLGSPAADQALGPLLNPVEMNNPDKRSVLEQVSRAPYAALWAQAWGEPLRIGDAASTDREFDRIGLAIAAFEASSEVNAFTSKFDDVERGLARFTPLEAWGKELFEGKAKCANCHMAPLFTDYTFDNLGVPRNPANPVYAMDPRGASFVDAGLGGFLATLPEAFFAALGLDKQTAVAENLGKHKVPTLRNVDKRPGPGFAKAFMHNGALKSLKDVVHFYNTRDIGSWPPPEVQDNVNRDELGNLGLTDAEENAVVAFMETLSDGYEPRATERPPVLAAPVEDWSSGAMPRGIHVMNPRAGATVLVPR